MKFIQLFTRDPTSVTSLFLVIFTFWIGFQPSNVSAQSLNQLVPEHQVLGGDFSNFLWPNGSTITVSSLNGELALTQQIVEIANSWSQHANIKFSVAPGRASDADVRILFTAGGSHNSLVGRNAHEQTLSGPTMNLGFAPTANPDVFKGTILHEFGHVIGLTHEQFHRGARIPFNETAVVQWFRNRCPNNPTYCWSETQIRDNILNPRGHAFARYDHESIMHYAIPNDWTHGEYSIRGNNVLSFGDKLAVGILYPGAIPTGKIELHRRDYDYDYDSLAGLTVEKFEADAFGGPVHAWSENNGLVSFVSNGVLKLSYSKNPKIPLKQGSFTLSTETTIRGMNWDGSQLSYILWDPARSQSLLYFVAFDGQSFGETSKPRIFTTGDNVRGWSLDNGVAAYVIWDTESRQSKLISTSFINYEFGTNVTNIVLSTGDNIRGISANGKDIMYIVQD